MPYQRFYSFIFIGMLLVGLSITPLLTLIQPIGASSEGWWNTDWHFRKAITINSTKVSGDLENFPVLIDVFDGELANKAQQDGGDIVFVDVSNNTLNHEIEFFDNPTGQLIAWVNLPFVSSTTDTKIYMYYGNSGAENQENPTAVWNPNYILVQHFEETSGTHEDSTAYNNDGIPFKDLNQDAAGKIDGADEYDGVNDFLGVANDPSLNPSSATTIELWMNLSWTGDYINLVNKGRYAQFYLRLGPEEGQGRWYAKFDDGTSTVVIGDVGWTEDKWHHIAATLDTQMQELKVYLDGVEKIGGTFDPGKSMATTTKPVLISDVGNWWVDGIIDEVRISSIARSAEWIRTSYDNQKGPSTFYTIGSEETTGGVLLYNENPPNGATDVYTNPRLSVYATSTGGNPMTIIFRANVSGTWEDILPIHSAVGNGTYWVIPTNMTNLGTFYHWSVCATDGVSWTNKTYSFRTTTRILEPKWTTTALGKGCSSVLVADVTGNDLEEVIYAAKGQVTVLNGTDGSVVWKVSDSGIDVWAQPQGADLDCDGILEIIVPLYRPAGLLVLHGNDGTLYWRRDTGLGLETYSSPVIADIDGDGYPTVFFCSTDIYNGLDGTGRVTSLSYDGQILHQTFSWRPCSGGLALADTDSDGEFELYMTDRNSGYGDGIISFWAKNLTRRWIRRDMNGNSATPILADVNKDGILDVIVGNSFGGIAVLRSTDGSAINRTVGIPDDAPFHYQPSVSDIDSDGNLELLMADGHHTNTGDDIVIWDLVKWEVDSKIDVGLCFYGPQVADITGDGSMEVIACNYSAIFVFQFDPFTEEYSKVDEDTNLVGELTYAVVQDIDGDGYSELLVSSRSGMRVYAYDTPARRLNPRPRSEVQFYSECRLGVAEYEAPPSQELVVCGPFPSNQTENVIVSISKLSFTLKNYQHNLMNYTVETSPNIGSGNETNVDDGRYSVFVSDLSPTTTYTWMVSVTDGTRWINRTYTFTTEDISPWWNTDWKYRKSITVDHTGISSDLSNFPVLIDVFDGDLANKAQQDGDDIVFVDVSNNTLNHEIEFFDNANGHLVAWVNLPFVSSTVDTKIYMYYGNSGAENQENPTAVWDSSYIMVQHFEETSGTHEDSTVYNNDAIPFGNLNQDVVGKIDGADEYDGVNDYLRIPNGFLPTSAITVEVWFNPFSYSESVWRKYLNTGPTTTLGIAGGQWPGASGEWALQLSWNGGTKKFNTGGQPSGYDWVHIVITWDGTYCYAYFNGLKIGEGGITGSPDWANKPLYLGSNYSGGECLHGAIDEARISSIARSADWIRTSYINQKSPSTFYTIGSEESI